LNKAKQHQYICQMKGLTTSKIMIFVTLTD